MIDVTELVLKYREGARHLWNTCFQGGQDWDVRDDFAEACVLLFRSLVLRPHDAVDALTGPASLEASPPTTVLRVIPAHDTGTAILINRSTPKSGYWDDPINRITASDAMLRFVQFFDWDEMEARDFQYVEAVIEASVTHPHLVGRHALIEVRYARFVLEQIGT
jgi:hypothetical protein